jgi:glycosyltransferase involved in cell wall biosynthesis
MTQPLVTVVCLCYNQGAFVREAIESVLEQTYPSVQLIAVDDASTDSSKAIIQSMVNSYPQIEFIALEENVGNCKAFNMALPKAKGEFIIDLAADDMLLPHRITSGMETFLSNPTVGVIFSDAELIHKTGNISRHSERFPHTSIPSGDVYRYLIERYFICSPTLMFRKDVINQLGGYDENLSYEDFDFLIRASRSYSFQYVPEVLVRKRVISNSLSNQQFALRSKHQRSTYLVCKKIYALNKNDAEKRALSRRIFYEIRLNVRLLNVSLCVKYLNLLLRNTLVITSP